MVIKKRKIVKKFWRKNKKKFKLNFNNDNMHKHVLFGFKTILAIGVSLVIILGFFGAGFCAGYQMGINKGWTKAAEVIAEAEVFDEVGEVFSLNGIVAKVDAENNKIYFNAEQPGENPLAPQAPIERVAIVSKNTPIIKVIDKPIDQLEQEELAYEQAREEAREKGEERPERPEDTVEMVYPLTAINEGDEIRVRSENDIYWEESFEVISVRIY